MGRRTAYCKHCGEQIISSKSVFKGGSDVWYHMDDFLHCADASGLAEPEGQ